MGLLAWMKKILGRMVTPLMEIVIKSKSKKVIEQMPYIKLIDKAIGQKWYKVALSDKTCCAKNAPYFMLIKKGTSDNLIIHFQGGGALWDAETAIEPITLKQFLMNNFSDELHIGNYLDEIALFTLTPKSLKGMFDPMDQRNAFKDWHVVLIPYATGDLHIGNGVVKYTTDDGREVNIHHNGYKNVSEALNWTYKNFQQAEKVIVAGSSAGGFASTVWVKPIAEHYDKAQVYNIADSAYIKSKKIRFAVTQYWNKDFQKDFGYEIGEDFTSSVFKNYAEHPPKNIKFLHANSKFDLILSDFNRKLKDYDRKSRKAIDEWSFEMKVATKQIIDSELEYQVFLTDYGMNPRTKTTPHTMLTHDLFYKQEKDGVTFNEWVKRNVIDGEDFSVGIDLLDR